jgi:CMP-N,N'-diacetyllegionaminic acid synthase
LKVNKYKYNKTNSIKDHTCNETKMKKKIKNICVICARAGSTRLKGKNFKKLLGKPLIYYTINQAIKSKIFDHIVFSTDSKTLKNLAIKYGAESWFLRPKKLADDKAAKMPVIRHAVSEAEKKFKIKFDYVFDLDVTSPLRDVNDIKKAFKLFLKSKKEMLISGNKARKNPYFNMVEFKKNNSLKLVKKSKNFFVRYQDAPKVYELNASIYIWKRKSFFYQVGPFCKKTFFYEMPYDKSIDIDNFSDFKMVEFFLKKK